MMTDAVALAGRVLMAWIFVQGGYEKLLHPETVMGSFGHLPAFAHQALPAAAYWTAVTVELVGGLLFLVGFKIRALAAVLAFWCVATALIAHYHPDDHGQWLHFMKNACMAGGFLHVAAFGSGRWVLRN